MERQCKDIATFFLRIILKRTSTEAHVYIRCHQGAKVEHSDVSNVIYHKFSHGAVSYTLNGENVNAMFEWLLNHFKSCIIAQTVALHSVFLTNEVAKHQLSVK